MIADHTVGPLQTAGFVKLPAAFSGAGLGQLVAAYEEVMSAAAGPQYKVGSTTDRMSNLLSSDPIFAEIFLYPPLLELCEHFFKEPFKVSSLLARTLRAGTPAQPLHADLPRNSDDAPLLGFVLMIDPFQEKNGATRFVPGSQHWPHLPEDILQKLRATYPGEVLGVGEAGSLIVFDAAIWHGHTANMTTGARRSVQGYFVRRTARSGFNFADRLPGEVQRKLRPMARTLLLLD